MKEKRIIETKAENKQAVLRYLMKNGPSTKQEIYAGSGLSLPTIKQALEYLETNALIEPSAVIKNTGGRNATAFGIKDTGRAAIGIYFSEHHITVVCTNLNGEIIASKRIRERLNLHDDFYLRKLGELAAEMKEQCGLQGGQLIGVGIAVPSFVSEDGESILFGMTHDYNGITKEVLSTYINEPTMLYHDSYCAGFAEVWNNEDLTNAIFLNLNNNVGGCIIVNHEIFSGNHRLAGEFGHITIDPHSEKTCYCGKNGCFETLCSATVLDSYTDGNLERFFEKVKENDPGALSLWNIYLDHLASAIHNLTIIFDCPVIIGGYIGTYIADDIENLRARFQALDPFNRSSKEYILPCRLRMGSTAAGAAILMTESFIQSI